MGRTVYTVYIVGVGMTKFEKPGSKEWDYPGVGAQGPYRRQAHDHRQRAGRLRLLLRRLRLRRASLLRARPRSHPEIQGEQQLLDGLECAVHGQATRRGRARRVHDGARL